MSVHVNRGLLMSELMKNVPDDSHWIATEFRQALKRDDLYKFIRLLNFTAERKCLIENKLADVFKVDSLIQLICSFFEFPPIREIKFWHKNRYLWSWGEDVQINIWNVLFIGENNAVEIFKFLLMYPELGIKEDCGLKNYFKRKNKFLRRRLDQSNILLDILSNPNLTTKEFKYGLDQATNSWVSAKDLKLFFMHKLLSTVNPFEGSWDGIRTFRGMYYANKSGKKNSFLHEMIANRCENEKIMFCLKNQNFDLNCQNYLGDTPFHSYIKTSYSAVELTEKKREVMNAFFARKDLNVHLKNKKGKTIFDLIQQREDRINKERNKNIERFDRRIIKDEEKIRKMEKQIENIKKDIEIKKLKRKQVKKTKKSLKRKLEYFMEQENKRKKN